MSERIPEPEIRRLLAEATPGPWHRADAVTRGGFTFGENEITAPAGIVVSWAGFDSASGLQKQRKADAALIAAAPAIIAQQARDIEVLRTELSSSEAACAAWSQRAAALEDALKVCNCHCSGLGKFVGYYEHRKDCQKWMALEATQP